MDLVVEAVAGATTGQATLGGRTYRCAVGRSGIFAVKHEGDGATPEGRYPLRHLYYRADRNDNPATRLPRQAISRQDGWCDDVADPAYNRYVTLPYAGRHEELWREDALYDLIVVIGHNDTPVVTGEGSAVFLHVASPNYGPTAGCVSFTKPDLLEILSQLGPDDTVTIRQIKQ